VIDTVCVKSGIKEDKSSTSLMYEPWTCKNYVIIDSIRWDMKANIFECIITT
jgi:hypothetical protein